MTNKEALEIVLGLANAYLDSDEMGEYSLPKHSEAIEIVKSIETDQFQEPYEHGHIRCSICGECITCNLRPCRNGGYHIIPSQIKKEV